MINHLGSSLRSLLAPFLVSSTSWREISASLAAKRYATFTSSSLTVSVFWELFLQNRSADFRSEALKLQIHQIFITTSDCFYIIMTVAALTSCCLLDSVPEWCRRRPGWRSSCPLSSAPLLWSTSPSLPPGHDRRKSSAHPAKKNNMLLSLSTFS